jgi:quercetin dioxygenase-like cupin family protein
MTEPSDQVATELLYENEAVRVWIMDLAPGQESPYHRHRSDYLFVYTTPSLIELRIEGQAWRTEQFDDGYAQYVNVGAGVAHQIKNVSDTPHRQVLIELKQSTREGQSGDNGRKRPA